MKSLKVFGLGLAVAVTTTLSMAKPVDYKIDPTHTATVFSWDHFGFLHRMPIFLIFRVQLR